MGTAILVGLVGMNWVSLQKTPDVSARTDITPSIPSPIRKCMNMGGALEANKEGDWGYVIRREDFQHIKSAGFDTVRVPIKFSAHAGERPPYTIDPVFLKRIDQVVDWALLEGLQIIIDVHHYNDLMKDPNAHEPRLEAIWDQLAHHYQKAPGTVMFELINEPHSQMDVARTDRLNARLVTRIRQDNPDRWIVVGSAGWGSLDALTESRPPKDRRLIATFHYYNPFELTHQGAEWMDPVYPLGFQWRGTTKDRADIRDDFSEVSAWQRQVGLPVFLGEFGAYEKADMSSRARWTAAVRQEAEQREFGWCYWEWASGFGTYKVDREKWVMPIRDALMPR